MKISINIFRYYLNHIKIFFNDFDSVKNISVAKLTNITTISQKNKLRFKIHYLIALFAILVFSVDSMFVLINGNVFKNSKIIMQSDRLFTHKIFPKQFWFQGDIVTFLSMSMAILNYMCLLINDLLKNKFCMFLLEQDTNDQNVFLVNISWENVNIVCAKKLISFRKLARKYARLLMFFVNGCLELYFVQQVIQKSLYSISSLFFFFVSLPLMVTYAVIGKFKIL